MRRHKSLGVAGSAAFVGLLLMFIDVQGNLAATGLVTSMLATPHVNPPPKSTAEKRAETTPIALLFQLEWKSGEPHDIDLAVQCLTRASNGESMVTNVNWRQVQDGWLRLSKDDLGAPTVLNVEKLESTSETRWVPASTTCWANAHVYHTKGGAMPLDSRLIAVHQRDSSDESLIADIPFKLRASGEELTLVVVSWDKDGKLMKDAIKRYPDVEQRLIMTAPVPWRPQQ